MRTTVALKRLDRGAYTYMASLQFKAFRERFDYLVKGVQADLNGIASRAYSRKLITGDTLQTVTNQQNDVAQRSISLVSSVHTSINLDERNFAVFVAILRAEPAVSGLADTLERTLQGLRDGPRMDGRGTGSSGTSMGGATAMDLDSGLADTSALSEVTDGEMIPPEPELVNVRNSSPPVDGDADQSDSDTRQRNSTYGQEVRQGSGADTLVTTPRGTIPRVGSSASLSTMDDKYNTRMELAQKDDAISVRETQVEELTRKLVDAEQEYQKVDREKSEIAAELRNKEAELQKVTKKKDKEIKHLKEKVQSKEKQISEYKDQIAELESKNTKAKEENERTRKEYEERLKQLKQSLEEAVETLRQKDVGYHKDLREREQRIHELQLARKDIETEKHKTQLANSRAKLAELLQKVADEKRQQAEEKHRAMEEKLREEQEKRQRSESEAEKKRRDSDAELENLRAQKAQLKVAQKMTDIPEDDADR